MSLKNQKTDLFLQFIKSARLDNFSYSIFDLDQTLYNYEICNDNGISHVINHINKKFHIDKEIILEKYLESRKLTNQNLKNTSSMHSRFLYLQKMSEMLAIENSINNTINFYNIYWESFFEKMELFEWVLPTFKKLQQKNVAIIIATDFNARIQFLKIKNLGLESYIAKVFTSQQVGEEKPSKKFAEIVLNATHSNSNQIFYVGDNPNKDKFLSNYDVKTFII